MLDNEQSDSELKNEENSNITEVGYYEEPSELSSELASVLNEDTEPSEEDDISNDESSDDSHASQDDPSSAETRKRPGTPHKKSFAGRINEFKRLTAEADDRAYALQIENRGLKQEVEYIKGQYQQVVDQHEHYTRQTDMVIQELQTAVYGDNAPKVNGGVNGNNQGQNPGFNRQSRPIDEDPNTRPLTRADFDRMRQEDEMKARIDQVKRNWDDHKRTLNEDERTKLTSALRRASQDALDVNPQIGALLEFLSDKPYRDKILRALQNRQGDQSYTRLNAMQLIGEAMKYSNEIAKNKSQTTRSVPTQAPRGVSGGSTQQQKKTSGKYKNFSDFISNSNKR